MDHKLTAAEAFNEMFACRRDTYTVPLQGEFYMEFTRLSPDDIEIVGEYEILEVTLCRDDFPLKRRLNLLSVKKGYDNDHIAALAAHLLVDHIIDEQDLAPFEDLLYANEYVTTCPCCGFPKVEVVPEPEMYGGINLLN